MTIADALTLIVCLALSGAWLPLPIAYAMTRRVRQ
jgi:hypothetical protein